MYNNRCFLIGSRMMEKLTGKINMEVVDCITDCSFLSKGNSKGNLISRIVEVCKKKPEYLIIDFYSCCRYLYLDEQKIFTYEGIGENVSELYNPALEYTPSMKKRFIKFMKVIKKYFSPDKIFIIGANRSRYYVVGRQLRAYKEYNKANLKLIKKLEKKFKKVCGGHYLGLTKYYFNEKEIGLKLNYEIFEDELYTDISCAIEDFLDKGIARFDRPLFNLCLQRYAKYQYRTLLYQAFNCFLDSTKLTDEIVLKAPGEFVRKHIDEFVWLKKLEEYSNEDIKNLESDIVLDTLIDTQFKDIILAYIRLKEDNKYNKGNVDKLKALFVAGIVPSDTLKEIRDYFAKRNISPKKISSSNAGYYFALQHGYDKESAEKFVAEDVNKDPTLICVYGTCVISASINERIIFNNNLICNDFYFQFPLYASQTEPIPYEESLFQDINNSKVIYTKMQFDAVVKKNIEESDSEWIILDCHYLCLPNYKYKNFVFMDYSKKIAARLNAKALNIWELVEAFGGEENYINRILTVCSWMKEKWKDKIILLGLHSSKYQLGDDGNIYSPRNIKKANEINSYGEKIFEVVLKALDCYFVDIEREFLADDLGYMSRSAVHFEFDYYTCNNDIINYIVKNKPQKKVYTEYPYEIRVNRLIKLLHKNNIAILREYFKKELDLIVMQLPYEVIKKYHKEIVEWYEAGYSSKDDVLSQNNWDNKMDLYVAVDETSEFVEIKLGKVKADYPDYAEWNVPQEVIIK